MDLLWLLSVIAGILVVVGLALQLVNYLFPWLKDDLSMIMVIRRSFSTLRKYSNRNPIYTLMDKLEECAKTLPFKVYVYFEEETWTFRRVNQMANQVARVMRDAGVKTNDTVALMMISRPEFIGTWFGIGKTGATTAFINYNIRGKSLLHCLTVCECKALVISNDQELVQAIRDIEEDLIKQNITIYVIGDLKEGTSLEHKALKPLLDSQAKEDTPLEWRKDLTMSSHFLYVYTSGTTGLPKAAVINHQKSLLVPGLLMSTGATESDIIYSPLPLYHAAAGLIGITGALELGCSIIIRRKFSASHFWPDCRRYKATIVQYIGETMRYICDQALHDGDRNHCVRAALGNGMRPGVWKKFLERYGHQIKIFEFYSATEGNVALINFDHHIGSIGRWSPLAKLSGVVYLVQYDQERDEVYRNSNGRCVPVPDGTPGLLIGRITERTGFMGYHRNKKQTEKKILRNVFKDGDAFFNSGDLLKRDHDYYLYFVDRIGDTFRWKGENVSTNEVADVLSAAPGIKEANVYGVEIPGNEGRAGMMVVLLDDDMDALDCSGVYRHACECLASYARPVFIRVKKEMELTGTFKQRKVQLVKDGFALPNMGGDPIFYIDNKNKRYSPLTQEIIDEIVNDKIRV